MEIELEGLHLFILAVTALAILFADHEGFSYMTGKKQLLTERRVAVLYRLVWAGFLGMIITGAIMVWPARSYYFSDTAFLAKMGFVVALFVNSLFIHKIMYVSTTTPFMQLERSMQIKLFVSGAVSGVGWVGATVVGFFFV